MVFDWAVNVNKINIRVGKHFVIAGVSFLNAELVAQLVQFRLVASAGSNDFFILMSLIDRDELGAKPQADYRNIQRSIISVR